MFTDKTTFKKSFLEKLELMHGKNIEDASGTDMYLTLGTMIREYVTRNWINTNIRYKETGAKQVYYFSMEFLLGRLMGSNFLNLGIREICEEGLKDLGIDLDQLEPLEPDAGLGNGGLGRLAACFLDSIASLNLPGHGCGIRYRYGLFEQKILEGYQVELPEYWLREANVWEIRKSDRAVEVRYGGDVRVEQTDGRLTFHHENYNVVLAVPYDIPIMGYHNSTVNTLRLWSAEAAPEMCDFVTPGHDNQQKILDYKYSIESISQFLYPDDTNNEGRILRLKQEYFFVSAGIQSIVRWYKRRKYPLADFPNKISLHINDTHPALAVAELMRILIDEEKMDWDEAFMITTKTVSYTNHTTLAEALETWPIDIFKALLPRIYMIVDEMNERFCQKLWNLYPGDWEKIGNMAIIADGRVRMSHLAIVGSHSVNGVARIHTEILKNREMKNFHEVFPYKFNNKTNGITHRRWLLKANPFLSAQISNTIGTNWVREPSELIKLKEYKADPSFQEKIFKIKQENKIILANLIKEKNNISVDINSIFDVHVKRIHGYKRQVLNLLHIMDLYNRLLENPDLDILPRTFIFGGKAAPGYRLATRIIKLINTVASVINSDQNIKDKIKVVFLENYRVSLAETIIPAADVSEQISTASKEASGTGNMKFMMNGAVTLGTLDGANIEIMEEVGDENIFIFGLSPSEVISYYSHGGYRSLDIYHSEIRIQKVLNQLIDGFSTSRWEEFVTIYDSLLDKNDEYFILKDFQSYADAQMRVDNAYRNRKKWLEMCVINIAHSGKFSSDRTITEYAKDIWKIKPVT
ncbi:MAG: glycogen/starch/alpha-glucan phosphorylase [Bacillota bacterium]|nr:glycogen/starch/alpha-glucan phosphorylase [Bacillota bacterium]